MPGQRAGQASNYMVGLLATLASFCALQFLELTAERPGRTPVVALSVSYPIERWPANTWVVEDTALVQQLDSDTFHIQSTECYYHPDPSDEITVDSANSEPKVLESSGSAMNPLDALENSIQSTDSTMHSDQPLLVYVNAHFAVNDRSELCLIGPHSLPQQSDTWHNFESFVQRYFEGAIVASNRPLVFLLETNRLHQWLPAGLMSNDIATRLTELAKEHAGGEQTRRISWLLVDGSETNDIIASGGSSLMTRLMCEVLSGHPGQPRKPQGGSESKSGDWESDWIDSNNLPDRLQQRFQRWASDHGRETVAKVRWIDTGGSQPLRLAPLASNWKSEAFQKPGLGPVQQDTPTIRFEHVFESFADTQVAQKRPWLWVRLHADAQRLDWVRSGGQNLMNQHATLDRRWANSVIRLQRIAGQHTAEAFQNDGVDSVDRALADIAARAERLGEAWHSVSATPTLSMVKHWVSRFKAEDREPCPLMMALLQNSNCNFWRQPSTASRVAKTRADAFRSIASVPVETFPSVRIWIDQIDHARRKVSDTCLLTSLPEDESLANAVDDLELCLESLTPQIRLRSNAWLTSQRTMVSLPFFWPFVLNSPESWSKTQVLNFLNDAQMIGRFIQSSPSDSEGLSDLQQKRSHQSVQRINAFLDQVEQQWRQHHFTSSADRSMISASQRRDIAETEALNQRFAEAQFQITSSRWSAWNVRQRLRTDATDQMATSRDDLPGWLGTIAMQDESLAGRWMSDYRNEQNRHRIYDEVERTLDDLWRGSLQETTPYFARLAKSMFKSLADSHFEQSSDTERQQSLQERLKLCREFLKEDSIRPVGRVNELALAGVNAEAEIHVEPSTNTTVGRSFALEVGGTALIQIRSTDTDARVWGAGKMNFSPLARRKQPTRIEIQSEALAPDQVAEIVLSFRGHEFVGQLAGGSHASLVRRRPQAIGQTARVSLNPLPVRRRAVVFVVDSSASMNELAATEQTRRVDQAGTKLDASRASLLTAADRLWQQDCDMGMVLYGHRVAIDAKRGSKLIQKRYAKQFPFSFELPAYRDVEVAIPVGRFGGQQYAEMENRLDNIVPWGQSPLYLALDSAIDDLSQSGPYQSRDIVVITDGDNYQFNPTPDAIISLDSVVQRARDAAIRVHVVGFASAANDRIDPSSVTNPTFASIAQGTGGWQAAGVHDFVNGLLQAENPNQTRIELTPEDSLGRVNGESHSLEVGETINLHLEGRPHQRWKLELEGLSKTIHLSPDDHVRLRLANGSAGNADGLSVERVAEENTPLAWLDVRQNDRTVAQQLGIWRSRLHDENATFVVGWRPTDDLTLARPEAVWIEVSALEHPSKVRPRTTGPLRYASSLVNWLPGHGLPIAEFSCDRWPQSSPEYALQVWAGTPPQTQFHWLPLRETNSRSWVADDFPEHRFELKKHEGKTTLTIRYPQSATENASDAMWMVAADDSSEFQITGEWYDRGGRLSVHELTTKLDAPSRDADAMPLTLTAAGSNSPQTLVTSTVLKLISVADFKRDATLLVSPYHGVVTSPTKSVGTVISRVSRMPSSRLGISDIQVK